MFDFHAMGVEVKRTDAPALTPSMRIALDNLRLEHLIVLHAGARRYPLSDRVTAIPLAECATSTWQTLLSRSGLTRRVRR